MLYDGTKEFNEEAIQKIADLINGDLLDIRDNVSALVEAGKSYKIYSNVNEEAMDSSVKFIIETEGIHKE